MNQVKIFFLVLVRLWLIVCLVVQPPVSIANSIQERISAHLNVQSHYTSAASIRALDRNVYYGGNFSLRNQLLNIELLNFDAPYINAGCGGIDMYGGSLSFINKEQFNLLLKSVASNAIGYSFSLALTHVCPTCSQITESLQRKIQMLNQYFGNSCALAQGIVNDSVAAITGSTNNKLSLMANIKGFGDTFTSFSSQASEAKQEVLRTNSKVKQNFYGNILLEAFKKAYGREFNQEQIMSMLSLTGTLVVIPQHKGKDEQDQIKAYPGNLTSFTKLINGGVTSQYTCANSKCEEIKIKRVTKQTLPEQIKELYLGKSNSGGVISLYETNRGSLTNGQKQQLLLIGEGINSQIKTLAQISPPAARDFVNFAANYIAYKYASQEIEYVFRLAFTALQLMQESPTYDKLNQLLQHSYQAYVDVINTYSELANPSAIVEYYNNLQLQLNPYYGKVKPQ
ncbi:hypothetical protein CKF54_03935 [Psittacicella hinzii]|uniref:Conjugative relaxosome accessory transposon protein n=1 Tax=Psittacicella hinzii TaxID=2028575 RepID=A0A3A1Y5T5_9GAMM|nr:conjugal transfer protein TraH [Psittacicella hinzii]RIY32851.1 hypothetical protein CKF54_03935 [Psittacicella hinzii]